MAFSKAFLVACLLYATPIIAYGVDSGPGPSVQIASTSESGKSPDQCPGYKLENAVVGDSSIIADLTLAGERCDVFGKDINDLKLKVDWESENRLHVHIYDAREEVFQVPEEILPRPGGSFSSADAKLDFAYEEEPFSFVVTRKGSSGPALFNTTGFNIIFESQYLRLRSHLVDDPNLYGLGESTDPFRLPTTDYVRTLWDKDTPFVPPGRNLYGSHPVYYEHRKDEGTHGVFLANSDGMDIFVDKTDELGQYIEYDTIGGTLDLYFMAGPTPNEVAIQYGEIVGKPQLPPYWAFGFHNCKYGYRDLYEQAEVIANYSLAGIPLEAFWSDIDYMDGRKIFTTDPERYPKHLFRQVIQYLHDHQQKSVFMNNPALGVNYPAFTDAYNRGVLMMNPNNTEPFLNVVWPGPAVFPDWFHPSVSDFWTGQIRDFYDPETGFDIDGIWIDMNEAAIFCPFPCPDPFGYAEQNNNPPDPPPVRPNSGRPIPGFGPDFQPNNSGTGNQKREESSLVISSRFRSSVTSRVKRAPGDKIGLPGRDLQYPGYKIRNENGDIMNWALGTDIEHYGGYKEYDVHNLYGRMMSIKTREAMQARRPGKRTLIISRSTWAGSGTDVGHWLGDNASRWEHYRFQITGLLQFASLYQIPMVGSDLCGFNEAGSEQMCARWTTLGAFAPFFRTHADVSAPHQELFLWESVTDAAIWVMDIRFRLMDYMYSQFHRQTTTGQPFILPMWFLYPNDPNTYPIEHQYFYGDSILISPVLEEDSTSVDAYFPNEIFYNFVDYAGHLGEGKVKQLTDIPYTRIPIHIRGGTIIASRVTGANTTTELRKKDFRIIVAPSQSTAHASGLLYLDDGESEVPDKTTTINFAWDGKTLSLDGEFDYDAGVGITEIVLAGQRGIRETQGGESLFNETTAAVTVKGKWSLLEAQKIEFGEAGAKESVKDSIVKC